jgi:hypothetical protein
MRLVVSEHQVEEVRGPQCQQLSRGSFLEGVAAPAQYGTGVKALAVYLPVLATSDIHSKTRNK